MKYFSLILEIARNALISIIDYLRKTPPDDPNLKKISIIVGHSREAKGAVNYLGEIEFDFNSRIASKVESKISQFYSDICEIRVFKRNNEPFETIIPKIKEYMPDFSMELHFNSFSQRAYGCEMLIYRDSGNMFKNIELADDITDRLSKHYNFKERHTYKISDGDVVDGVKVLSSNGRGVRNLKGLHNIGIDYVMILEPVFANFETSDSRAIFENEDKYVDVLVESIIEDVLRYI